MVNHKKKFKLWKNPNYQLKSKKGIKKSSKKTFIDKNRNPVKRNLDPVIFVEGFSEQVQQKYCDITGYPCVNTHPKSYLNYLDSYVYKYIKNMSEQAKQTFRGLRNIKRGF